MAVAHSNGIQATKQRELIALHPDQDDRGLDRDHGGGSTNHCPDVQLQGPVDLDAVQQLRLPGAPAGLEWQPILICCRGILPGGGSPPPHGSRGQILACSSRSVDGNRCGYTLYTDLPCPCLTVFDAWGKFPQGLLYGHFMDMGNYESCLSLDLSKSLGNVMTINAGAKYCLSRMQFESLLMEAAGADALTLSIGTCIPSSCSAAQLSRWMSGHLKDMFGQNSTEATLVQEKDCSLAHRDPMNGLDWLAVWVKSRGIWGIPGIDRISQPLFAHILRNKHWKDRLCALRLVWHANEFKCQNAFLEKALGERTIKLITLTLMSFST